MIIEEFEKIIGPMEPAEIDKSIRNKVDELKVKMVNDNWLNQKGKHSRTTEVKIRSGVTVFHRIHKAPGGLIRGDLEIRDGHFVNVSISGDFFCFPPNAVKCLENEFVGRRVEHAEEVLKEFCFRKDIEIPGIGVKDWMHIFKVN